MTADQRVFATVDDAKAACVSGWNLRCNRCGGYGANWIPGMRPGWGALALCRPHQAELTAEERRHADAMRELTAVRFEQDPTKPVSYAYDLD